MSPVRRQNGGRGSHQAGEGEGLRRGRRGPGGQARPHPGRPGDHSSGGCPRGACGPESRGDGLEAGVPAAVNKDAIIALPCQCLGRNPG